MYEEGTSSRNDTIYGGPLQLIYAPKLPEPLVQIKWYQNTGDGDDNPLSILPKYISRRILTNFKVAAEMSVTIS